MSKLPRISDAEWHVMQVLWEASPLTANNVVEALDGNTAWSPKTVRTMINRLVSKGALDFTKKGRTHHYYPLVSRTACAKAESRSFLRRVYGGALQPMLATFLEVEDLSPGEIEELKRILEERGKGES